MSKYFAAFIITYERAHLLKDTIDKVLGQTFPPEKILVVDNSDSLETQYLLASMNSPLIDYYRVGYNSGPAGGAKIGLQKLVNEGYEWIYWGDDNDPPKSLDCFEKLLSNANDLQKPGVIGAVGHALNRSSMVITRTLDSEIQSKKWIEVDVISGGMCMLVNSEVIKQGALPDETMFYGFEELDFCMQVQKTGYSLFVLSDLFQYYRLYSKRPLINAGRRGLKKNAVSLWREYYSTRNILYITSKEGHPWARTVFMTRSLLKIIYSFRFGWYYGIRNATFILLGIYDYFSGKMGRRIFS